MNKCPITNKQIEDPVFSPVTGLIYERASIEAEIKKNGKCPITGKEIGLPDLFEVKSNPLIVKGNKNNIFDDLSNIQMYYNQLVYEKVQLLKMKKEIEKDLGDMIYKNQSATKVIARLIKEKAESNNE